MCKLVLNKGDTVRNIRQHSSRKGKVGTVTETSYTHYRVTYANGLTQDYLKDMAHVSLEKLVSVCPCQQPLFKLDLNGRDVDKMMIDFIKRGAGDTGIYYVQAEEPKRRVLKKVRRNVITGKTQDDYVRDLGHARGVEQFNTRALGKSTGQALAIIGTSMVNPGVEIHIAGVDHYLFNQNHDVRGSLRANVDKCFRELVKSLIGNMQGFTITNTHIVFNPIVTEETYVEL